MLNSPSGREVGGRERFGAGCAEAEDGHRDCLTDLFLLVSTTPPLSLVSPFLIVPSQVEVIVIHDSESEEEAPGPTQAHIQHSVQAPQGHLSLDLPSPPYPLPIFPSVDSYFKSEMSMEGEPAVDSGRSNSQHHQHPATPPESPASSHNNNSKKRPAADSVPAALPPTQSKKPRTAEEVDENADLRKRFRKRVEQLVDQTLDLEQQRKKVDAGISGLENENTWLHRFKGTEMATAKLEEGIVKETKTEEDLRASLTLKALEKTQLERSLDEIRRENAEKDAKLEIKVAERQTKEGILAQRQAELEAAKRAEEEAAASLAGLQDQLVAAEQATETANEAEQAAAEESDRKGREAALVERKAKLLPGLAKTVKELEEAKAN